MAHIVWYSENMEEKPWKEPITVNREKCEVLNLWHVESWLSNSQFKYGSGPFCVSQDGLQLWKLDPGGAVFWTELQILLVELPAAVKLSQL